MNRALDFRKSLSLTGDAFSRNGVMSTATGLVFAGEDSERFKAFDARAGRRPWNYSTDGRYFSSPVAYAFDQQEKTAISHRDEILVFGLGQ